MKKTVTGIDFLDEMLGFECSQEKTENPNDTSETNVPYSGGGLPWLRGSFDLPEDFNPYFPKEAIRLFLFVILLFAVIPIIALGFAWLIQLFLPP